MVGYALLAYLVRWWRGPLRAEYGKESGSIGICR